MVRLLLRAFGLNNLVLDSAPLPLCSAGQALVKVEAAGLNQSDVTNAKGGFSQTTLPRVLGRDYAGVVIEGPEEWKGVAVWGSGGELGFQRDGTHSEYVLVPANSLVRKPGPMSFVAAAAGGVPFLTAFLSIRVTAQLQPGETVLVTGAAGSVGRAACEIARARGATVIGVVKEDESPSTKATFVKSDDHALSRIHELTAGKGVNVCLDTVGGPLFALALSAMAQHGRVVVIAAQGNGDVTFDLKDFYHRQLTLLGVDSLKLSTTEAAASYRELNLLVEQGKLTEQKVMTKLLAEAPEAYRSMEAGGSGKVVIIPTATAT